MTTNHDNHQQPIITIMCTGCGGVIERSGVNGGGQR